MYSFASLNKLKPLAVGGGLSQASDLVKKLGNGHKAFHRLRTGRSLLKGANLVLQL